MGITVTVTDKSPKRIVRDLIIQGKGPRDYKGMNAVLDEWLNHNPGGTFGSYCKKQDWTLAQVLSILDYQCSFIMYHEGQSPIDESEFNDLWPTFRDIIKKQRLLDVTKALVELGEIKPQSDSRGGAIEV